jgi:hypothetical protein
LHFEEKLGYYIFFRLWEQHPLTNVPEGTTEDKHEYEEGGEDIEGEEEEKKITSIQSLSSGKRCRTQTCGS